MMVEIRVLPDGWHRVISCQMYGFLTILLSLLKFHTIPSSPKVGGMTHRAPKDWTLQGSNDNSTWDIVDSESNQIGWGQWETRTYAVSSPSIYRYYKLVISDNNGDNTVGVGEIQYFTNPNSQVGKYGNAIDLKDDHIDLPFKVDQGSTTGMTFSAWIYPRQVEGGVDNERIIFSTDDGGWDWTMAVTLLDRLVHGLAITATNHPLLYIQISGIIACQYLTLFLLEQLYI